MFTYWTYVYNPGYCGCALKIFTTQNITRLDFEILLFLHFVMRICYNPDIFMELARITITFNACSLIIM